MNIKDIARLAGVSTSTVSKIVNHKDADITDATRQRVLDLVRRYHYAPYSSAKPQTASWRIGVLLRSSISMDTTLDGIIKTAQAEGYGTLVFDSFSDRDQEEANLKAALEQKVDGIIWEPVGPESLTLKKLIKEEGVPELTIGPLGDDRSSLLPYEEAAYRITRELVDRKHTSIACLVTPGRRMDSFLRGYRRCLFDRNLEFHEDLVFRQVDDETSRIMDGRQVTGVVASHYRLALELLQFAQSLHYRIPQDFSLVSLKNDTSEPLRYPGSPAVSSYTMRNADFGSYLCGRIIDTIGHRTANPETFDQAFHLDGESTVAPPPRMRRKRIVVVGSINFDTYLTVPDLPRAGMTVSTHTYASTPGGKAANQAIGAARLGHRVSLIGNVGNDATADKIYGSMRRAHVDTTGIKRVTGRDTGKAYIFVDDRGESTISLVAGANATLTPADIRGRERLFENAAYCLVQTEIPLDAVQEACRTARRHGAKTIVKPSSCTSLPGRILEETDMLIPNLSELETICPGGGTKVQKAERLIKAGAGMVIITEGERGCTLVTGKGHRTFPARKTRVVDDTGAGDAFISALAACLLDGVDLEKAIFMANQAAAFSVSQEGVIPSMVDRQQLECLMSRKEAPEGRGRAGVSPV